MSELGRIEKQECERVKDLLDDFISDELSVESNREILSHLESCPGCLVERDRRKQVRSALKWACDSETVPSGLRPRILAEISQEKKLPSWILRVAAAILLLALGGTGYLLMPEFVPGSQQNGVQIVDHYAQVVQDHLRCNGVPAKATPLPLDPYQRDIMAVLKDRAPRFDLRAVMECRAGDASFIHYVFEGDTGLLSVMIEKHDQGEILPSKGLNGRIQDASIHLVEGYPRVVAAIEAPGNFVYIIGDNFSETETRRLTERLYPPLKRALF